MSIVKKIKSFNANIISNLIKETNSNVLEEGKVWNERKVEEATEALTNGRDYEMGSPFFEKKIGYKRADLVYDYSKEELKELKKCKNDILYFAEKYCQIKGDDGKYSHFKLRSYQKKFLRMCQKNRFMAYCSSRQIGKCFLPNIYITIRTPDKEIKKIQFIDFYYSFVETGFLGKIKKVLWKIYSKLDY